MNITFTPKQEEAANLVQSEQYNFILYGGAIRGGKTVWGLSMLLVMCSVFPRSRWAVIRQNSERIRKTTIPSFGKLEPSGRLKQSPYEYIHPNGSVILFIGENYDRDKELDAFKGLEVNGFLFEEINECQHQTLEKAIERSGTWIIPSEKGSDIKPKQPHPVILATCNPTPGWVKEKIYNLWKEDNLPDGYAYIPAKITDNPHLEQAYINNLKLLSRYQYLVFVDGDWDIMLKTGGEFYKHFELDKHVSQLNYKKGLPIHVSLDENVNPYLSCSIWQLEGSKAYQLGEIALRNPKNTLKEMGKAIVSWCNRHNHDDVVVIYGDRTSLKEDTKLEKGQNFFTMLRSYIDPHYHTRLRLPSSNPPVAMSGEFVNACYEYNYAGIEININEICKESISDYIETKEDADGTVKKEKVKDPETKVTYEKNGHFSDNKRYILCEAFKTEFLEFQNKNTTFSPTIVKRVNTKRR